MLVGLSVEAGYELVPITQHKRNEGDLPIRGSNLTLQPANFRQRIRPYIPQSSHCGLEFQRCNSVEKDNRHTCFHELSYGRRA